MFIAMALLTATLAAPSQAPRGSGCLHDAGSESKENRDRSVAALGAARAINTAQSKFSATERKAGGAPRKYATREELQSVIDPFFKLSPSEEVVPGFKLTLDTTAEGYWFEIVDTKDSCGFRYVSNQSGLILAAQPIR